MKIKTKLASALLAGALLFGAAAESANAQIIVVRGRGRIWLPPFRVRLCPLPPRTRICAIIFLGRGFTPGYPDRTWAYDDATCENDWQNDTRTVWLGPPGPEPNTHDDAEVEHQQPQQP